MEQKYYVAQVQDKTILNKSSSGGIFYSLAKIILANNGVVFGAAWTNNFTEVSIQEANTLAELEPLLKSKYICSGVGRSFSRIKELLENNKVVLFSGLPCQVYALKTFLKEDYNNLICIEVCCHGVLAPHIWKDYLKSIQRTDSKITSINMRDKRNGWSDFGFAIKYSDGYEFFESKKINKYMQAFLSDKYLNKSCYDCKFKNEFSKADLILGDFWNRREANLKDVDEKLGLSIIVINTEKGLDLINSIPNLYLRETTKEIASKKNGGMRNKITKPKETYNKSIFNKDNKVAIITLNFNENIGGLLQGYALQKFLTDNFYDTTIVQNRPYKYNLEFIKKLKVEFVDEFSRVKTKYNTFIVGSDQIWRRKFLDRNLKGWANAFLSFCKNEKVKRIGYAISCGTNEFEYKDVLNNVKVLMKKFNNISLREYDLIPELSNIYGKNITLTADPTLLLDEKDYLELCTEVPIKKGLFTYILDSAESKDKIIKNSLEELKLDLITIDRSKVEEWLAAYRDCNCIITDSYHGCLFSIIFNKPFICFYNKKRGNSRFETLIKLFNLKDRFIDPSSEIDISLLKKKPNVDKSKIVEYSKKYLLMELDNGK